VKKHKRELRVQKTHKSKTYQKENQELKRTKKIFLYVVVTVIIILVSLIAVSIYSFVKLNSSDTKKIEKFITKSKQIDSIQDLDSKYTQFEEQTDEEEKDYIPIASNDDIKLEDIDKIVQESKLNDTNITTPIDTDKQTSNQNQYEEKYLSIKEKVKVLNELKKIEERHIQYDILQTTPKEVIKSDIKEDKKINKNKKPKLVIIIDDVTTAYQVKKIKEIGYNINLSFLPPTNQHLNSAKIANSLKHYMVHLPLEAFNFPFEEENTLHIGDGYQKIKNRIRYITQIYPKVKYINNHTGSKFTSNHQAMDRLFRAIKYYNLAFVDSRTSNKTVSSIYAKKYNIKFFSRNIFLDNKQDYRYIQKQLKKAMVIAKHRGYAIAIGHPYNITFKVLKDNKDITKNFDLVYIDQL